MAQKSQSEELKSGLENGGVVVLRKINAIIVLVAASLSILWNFAQPLVWKNSIENEVTQIKKDIVSMKEERVEMLDDIQELKRYAIMNTVNLQSLLKHNGIEFQDIPEFNKKNF